MLEALTGLPDDVIGFEAVGEIEASDYTDVLVPAIEAAIDAHHEVRLVFVLGDRFDGYSRGALWEDSKLGTHHLSAWERTAVVTDLEWVAHLISALGWMIPGHIKHFPLDQRAIAAEWAHK